MPATASPRVEVPHCEEQAKIALRALAFNAIGDATEEERQALWLTIAKLLLVAPTVAESVEQACRMCGCGISAARVFVAAPLRALGQRSDGRPVQRAGMQLSGLSDDLLRAHPQLARWATSAPRGKAGAVAGALIGLGLVAAKERGGDLLGEESTLEEPPQRRTSIGPNAIPPARWGHRPMPGGVRHGCAAAQRQNGAVVIILILRPAS